MARQDKQINFRIPHKLVEELKQNAEVNKRSMTAQLNHIIEEWLKHQPKIIK
ncbi:Arc family DNA-binding protein [Acinetobacter johnsonii]|uniref:Arc family DNA-binding protein n=1 Tax=Acinetobacter johnsonii TaxID=40214 RepID=UPI0024487DAF|nr:Arc family DNA-binding protein [Acinetobacter johnsonii]MDH1700057.1 Arc family DNA-binding protein [Acinetobacter johnsonii]